VVGSLGITWLTQYLQVLQDYRMVVFGPLLILLIIFFPRGLVGFVEHALARRRAAAAEARVRSTCPAARASGAVGRPAAMPPDA